MKKIEEICALIVENYEQLKMYRSEEEALYIALRRAVDKIKKRSVSDIPMELPSGFEGLKEKLIADGFSAVKINTLLMATAISYMADNPEFLDLSNSVINLKAQLKELKNNIDVAERESRRWKDQLERDKKTFNQGCHDYVEYIDKFLSALNECETPEGRDAIRIAQTFRNSVEIKTCYDNTAFIKGLALILTNGKFTEAISFEKVGKSNVYEDVKAYLERIEKEAQDGKE